MTESPPPSQRTTVFLDTEVFVQQNFQYSKGLLEAFRQHVHAGRLRLVITDVTIGEVKAKIAQSVEGARIALKRFQSDGRVLRNSQSPSVRRMFKSVNRRRVLKDLTAQFSAFLDDLGTTRLSTDDVKPSAVFSRYFAAKPPFDNPKKKTEFPDAFVMEALRLFGGETRTPITVVTGDPDWASFAQEHQGIEHVERLDQLLQAVQEGSPLLASAGQAVAALEAQIKEVLATQAKGLGFFVVDRQAAIVGVEVSYVHLHDTHVVNVTDEIIVFSSDASVGFDVSVEYPARPDPSAAHPWDLSFYGRRRFEPRYEEPSLHAYESFHVFGTLRWRASEAASAEFDDLTIGDPRPVPVYHDEYES